MFFSAGSTKRDDTFSCAGPACNQEDCCKSNCKAFFTDKGETCSGAGVVVVQKSSEQECQVQSSDNTCTRDTCCATYCGGQSAITDATCRAIVATSSVEINKKCGSGDGLSACNEATW